MPKLVNPRGDPLRASLRFRVGFFADDDALIAFLAKRLPFNPPWYDLYRFSAGATRRTHASRRSLAGTASLGGQRPRYASTWFARFRARSSRSTTRSTGRRPPAITSRRSRGLARFSLPCILLFKRILPSPTLPLSRSSSSRSTERRRSPLFVDLRATRPDQLRRPRSSGSALERSRPLRTAGLKGRWLAPLGMIVGHRWAKEMGWLWKLAFWVNYEAPSGLRARSTWKDLDLARRPCPSGSGSRISRFTPPWAAE